MEIVVAITGASGVVIGVRLLDLLAEQAVHTVHLIVSSGAEPVLAQEVGPDLHLPATHRWAPGDLSAPICQLLTRAAGDGRCALLDENPVGHRPWLCRRPDWAGR